MPIFTVGAAGTTSDDGFNISNSLRFDSGSNDSITRTNGSTTNRRTYTVSFWLKKVSTTTEQHPVFAGDLSGSNPYFDFRFDSSQIINWYHSDSGGSKEFNLKTNAVFKDPSAWYHFVLALDTTQATASNRVKLYVNGVQITSFSEATYPAQNFDTAFNVSGYEVQFGAIRNNSPTLNGYMAEMVLIDGQQLTPTSFGEFDSDTGIWKPIDVSELTFGTNGFHLNVPGSSTGQNANGLGGDSSGNDNHFASSGLSAADQSVDVPTNNFCTINPLSVGPRNNGQDSSGIITLGATKCVFNGSGDDFGTTMAVSTGKWYWEAKLITAQNHGSGFADVEHFTDGDYDASNSGVVNSNGFVGSAEYSTSSQYILNGTATSSAASYADNDIVGYAFDVDAGEMKIYQNGTLRDTITSIPTGVTYMPIIGDDSSTDASFEVNFGGTSGFTISSGNTDGKYGNFEYAPPSGYYALCTKRLAEFG